MPQPGQGGAGGSLIRFGTDGKLGQTGIVIPEFITEDELARYLADLFHEDARPGMDDVRRLPPAS